MSDYNPDLSKLCAGVCITDTSPLTVSSHLYNVKQVRFLTATWEKNQFTICGWTWITGHVLSVTDFDCGLQRPVFSYPSEILNCLHLVSTANIIMHNYCVPALLT